MMKLVIILVILLVISFTAY
ncbi:type I toxin-antitoxin system Ibs family toxin [Trabulsiella odontotermitis]|nr:type I toxin-antitoxin system Ibs family toxin [Trabulsiella odontotermitis]WHP33542.1 type I toxin-antitoxin system Ibs family toxin [Trabulsiella odontotermitis]